MFGISLARISLLTGTSLGGGVGVSPTLDLNFRGQGYSAAMTAYTFDQIIDYTRTSAATYVANTGFVTQTPASRNLLQYTQDFDNAAWGKSNATITANSTVAPDGTMTADTFTPNNGATDGNATQVVNGATASVAYTLSYYVKSAGLSPIRLRVTARTSGNVFISDLQVEADLSAGTVGAVTAGTFTSTSASITSVGGGWYRISLTGTTPATTGILWVSVRYGPAGNGTSGFYLWGAQLEAASAASTYTRNNGGVYPPRFDYDPVTLAPRGLLIEEQRTNLFTNSEFPNGLSDAPTRGGNVSISAFSLLPGNTGLAINNTGPVTSFAYKTNFTTVVSTTYTLSAFVRMTDGNAPSFVSSVTTDSANSFVLVIAGSAISPTTYTVTAMGNGFYRVSATATAASASVNNGVLKYDTNDSRSFTVSGYQLEAGAFATSYIPTAASQVTRTADVATITGANFSRWYNQTSGTFLVEWRQGGSEAVQIAASVNDGTANNIMSVLNDNSSAAGVTPGAAVTNGGVAQANLTGAAITAGSTNKTALAYALNDFAYSQNGAAALTDTSGTIPTVDRLDIGNRVSALFTNGHIRRIKYYPVRLSNAQIQALTA